MNKKELAIKIYNDLADSEELIDDEELINNREIIIETIKNRLSSYLIVDGGNILKDDKGNIRI